MALPIAIVMDVDQVLLDYASRLREFVNAKHGKVIIGHSLEWDLTEWLQVEDPCETQPILEEFSRSYEFGTLDAFPGADVVLHNLLRSGYRLIALTACGTNPLTMALRKVNMFHRFGDIFEQVHFVEFTDSKSDKLLDIGKSYDIKVFIDDKPQNILDAIYDTGQVRNILMKAPHNRKFREVGHPDVDYAFSWYECEQLIKGY